MSTGDGRVERVGWWEGLTVRGLGHDDGDFLLVIQSLVPVPPPVLACILIVLHLAALAFRDACSMPGERGASELVRGCQLACQLYLSIEQTSPISWEDVVWVSATDKGVMSGRRRTSQFTMHL